MVLNSKQLGKYLDSVASDPSLDHIQTIRIGSKSLAYWPYKYVTDDDADDMLALLKRVSHKALPLCCASAVFLSKTVLLCGSTTTGGRLGQARQPDGPLLAPGRALDTGRARGHAPAAGDRHPDPLPGPADQPHQRRPEDLVDYVERAGPAGADALLHVHRARHRRPALLCRPAVQGPRDLLRGHPEHLRARPDRPRPVHVVHAGQGCHPGHRDHRGREGVCAQVPAGPQPGVAGAGEGTAFLLCFHRLSV
eukprot:SAG22_NODE_750_length_7481_cov_19.618667_3_plen_251_part_00